MIARSSNRTEVHITCGCSDHGVSFKHQNRWHFLLIVNKLLGYIEKKTVVLGILCLVYSCLNCVTNCLFNSYFEIVGYFFAYMTINIFFIEGIQRFIRVYVYFFSSSSLLTTFSEQYKDFFSKRLLYFRIMLVNISTNADMYKFSLCKRICEKITLRTFDLL